MPQNRLASNSLRPGDFPIDMRHNRRTLFLANSFEVSIAIAGFFGALLLLLVPSVRSETASGLVGFSFGIQWAILYMLGSAGIIAGLWRAEDRYEIAGLALFGAAAFVNGLALVQVKGFPAPGSYIAFQYLGFSISALVRAWLLLRLRRVGIALGKRP